MIRAIVEYFARRRQRRINRAFLAGMYYANNELRKDKSAGDRLWAMVWMNEKEPFDAGIIAVLEDQMIRDPSIPEGYKSERGE